MYNVEENITYGVLDNEASILNLDRQTDSWTDGQTIIINS